MRTDAGSGDRAGRGGSVRACAWAHADAAMAKATAKLVALLQRLRNPDIFSTHGTYSRSLTSL